MADAVLEGPQGIQPHRFAEQFDVHPLRTVARGVGPAILQLGEQPVTLGVAALHRVPHGPVTHLILPLNPGPHHRVPKGLMGRSTRRHLEQVDPIQLDPSLPAHLRDNRTPRHQKVRCEEGARQGFRPPGPGQEGVELECPNRPVKAHRKIGLDALQPPAVVLIEVLVMDDVTVGTEGLPLIPDEVLVGVEQGEARLLQVEVPDAEPHLVLDDPARPQLADINGGPSPEETPEPVPHPQLGEDLEVLGRLDVGVDVKQVVALRQIAGRRRVRTVHLPQGIPRKERSGLAIKPDPLLRLSQQGRAGEQQGKQKRKDADRLHQKVIFNSSMVSDPERWFSMKFGSKYR